MLTIIDKTSANTTDIHNPFKSKSNGSPKIIIIWKTNVLKNDISADIIPLFKAVNNEEAKMLKPLIIKDSEKIRIANVVMETNSLS